MALRKPSLAVRAIAQLVDRWPSYAHGESLSGNLSLAGFNVLNEGNFASVVEGKPGQVIKLFNLKDLGYQYLIQYATTIESENLAAVHSFTKSGQYGIVELERLEHQTKMAVRISEYIDRCKFNHKAVTHKWGDAFRDSILNLDQAVKAHNIKTKKKLTWDCHEDNIMFRGPTPVLVDVIFGEA